MAIDTESATGAPDSAGVEAVTEDVTPRTAPTSRATPTTERQSGRLGLSTASAGGNSLSGR